MRILWVAAAVVGCSSGSKPPPSSAVRADVGVRRACPWVIGAARYLGSYWARDLAPDCPTKAFGTGEPVCGPEASCPRPCRSTLYAGSVQTFADYTYDADGHVVAIRGDQDDDQCTYEHGRLVSCTTKREGAVRVTRDSAGRIVKATHGRFAWSYTYNAAGDLASASMQPPEQVEPMIWAIEYDRERRLLRETSDGQTVAYTRDDKGRMIERTHTSPDETIRETFTYDDADRLIASSSSNGYATTYRYDAEGRLVEWSAENPANPGKLGTRLDYDCGK